MTLSDVSEQFIEFTLEATLLLIFICDVFLVNNFLNNILVMFTNTYKLQLNYREKTLSELNIEPDYHIIYPFQ